MSGEATSAMRTLYKPDTLIAVIPASAMTAPTIPPINACDELPGSPKNHVMRFQTIAPTRQAAIASRVRAPDCTTWSPIVFATTMPNKNGPRNSAIDVIPSAVCGANAREEIMVATTLLESRMPVRKSNSSASAMTMMSSLDISDGSLHFFYDNVCNNVSGFVSAIGCVREVTVHFPELQHFHHVMEVFGAA